MPGPISTDSGSKGLIVLRRVTSRGTTRLTPKLLAAHNYWLSLPVTDDDAANAHDPSARQSSHVVINSGAIPSRR